MYLSNFKDLSKTQELRQIQREIKYECTHSVYSLINDKKSCFFSNEECNLIVCELAHL